MDNVVQQWREAIGVPSEPVESGEMTLLARYEYPDFDAELYSQPNGKGTFQRVMMAFPKNADKPCPAVAVPFYFAEAMLGFDPATGGASCSSTLKLHRTADGVFFDNWCRFGRSNSRCFCGQYGLLRRGCAGRTDSGDGLTTGDCLSFRVIDL